MANRIKGITVEIGGDTTGLDKALKGVNSTIKTTQSSLKDVNKLLKLDPTNTNLVTQKQKLLKDAVNATKEKLDALKTAQEQARQQLEEGTLGQDKYDALQREIIETEEELRRLQQEAETTSTVLSKIDEAGKKLEKVGDTIAGAGRAVMPVSGAVAGLGAAAVKTSADFDSAMSQVAAVSGATGSDFDALRDKAREMGSKTKFSASEAAQAMNYMAMAGWKTEDMLSGIAGIMNLAAASGEDLATTSDIVTDALTAFGLSADDSGHFADLLAAASSNANTNVSMMGETFKYCAPIAGALGYSAEDTAEAIGLMANSGIKGSQAGTSLRTIMTQLQGELKLSGKALGDVTIQTTNADGSMRDFSDIIADCRGAFSKMTESEKAAAAETLVGKNAMSGFLALMNAAPGDIEKLETAISTCSDEVDGYSGAAERMAAVMQDNLNGQLTILKSQIEELAISFGDALMPAIRKIVTGIQGFIDKLNGMSEGQRNAILRIGLFVAALGPFLVILGTCISKVGVAMQGFVKLAGVFGKLKVAVGSAHGVLGKIGAALGGVSAPVLAVVAVIAVLVAAFLHLWRTNEGFREAIIGTWEKIRSTISTFVEGIKERLSALGFSFSDIAAFIRTVWDGLCQFLGPVFIGAFNAIATQLQMILGVITGIFDIFSGLFTGNWTLVWQGVSEIFSSIWEGMKGLFEIALNTIKGLAEVVLSWFGTTWNEAWTAIKEFFTGLWDALVLFFTGVMEGIRNTVSTVLTSISQTFTNIWNAIKATVSSVITAIRTTITNVWNAIKEFINSTLSSIKNSASSVWNSIKTTITTIIGTIKSTISSVWNAIKSTTANVFNGIKSKATSTWNAIKTAIVNPVQKARDMVKAAIDKMRSFFNFSWSLPHLKLPHVSIWGHFSLMPPSTPHFSVSWYKEGGIMTKPTMFGINGSSIMAGGEAGAEAILPLKGFYDQLSAMLDERLNVAWIEKYLAIIADNSSRGIYLEDGTLVGHLLPAIDAGLAKYSMRGGRGNR